MTLVLRPSPRTLLCALAALVAALVLFGVAGAPAARAATQPQALLLTDSVIPSSATDAGTGDTQSLEQQQAEAAGYQVTAVNGTTWDSMTASQFANYQLLIIGDPGCGTDAVGTGSAALSDAGTWEPVVMASGGNKVVIGTDPTRHYILGNAPSAPQLEQNSLAYAGAVSGATGVYLDLGCTYHSASVGTDPSILDGLSSGTGSFGVEGWNDPSLPGGQACATGVNIVAATGPTNGLTDSELSNWNCSVQEAFTSFPSGYTPMAIAPTGSGFRSSYCADDVQTKSQVCGAPYILVSGGGVRVSSDISVSPSLQDAPTSPTSHGSATMTATVTSGGSPDGGVTVTFTVNGGPDTGQTQTVVTGSDGQASFTLNNNGNAGTDSVSASFTNTTGNVEKALAAVNFTGPGQVYATAQNVSGTEQTALGDPVVATFVDPSGTTTASGWTTSVNWGDGTTDSAGTVSGSPSQYTLNADHTYAAPGRYTITITITDTASPADTTTITSTATITKGQLAVTGHPVSNVEGTALSGVQVASFTNSDTAPGVSSYAASINWGDGTTASTGTLTPTGTPGQFTVTGDHTYAEAGSYTITTTITGGDDPTATASSTSTATVTEAALNVTATPVSTTTGAPFSGQVATFTDGDTLTPVGDYTSTINWGDGTTTSGTVAGSSGSFTVSGSHTYTTAAAHKITVTVTDDGTSANDSYTTSTADTTLTVTGRGELLLPSETFTAALATITYGTTSAPASGFTAKINWGDGSTGNGTVTGSGGTYTVTPDAPHTFPGVGPYPVKITVTDPASGTGSATTTILVPSTLSSLTLPPWVSASKLLCGAKRHAKCTGVTILGTFVGGGNAVWNVTLSKSGKGPVVVGVITRKVVAGRTALVFRVTNRREALTLYRLFRRHKLNMLAVHQVFTNLGGGTSQVTLSSRLTP